jgi:hypothetical protein
LLLLILHLLSRPLRILVLWHLLLLLLLGCLWPRLILLCGIQPWLLRWLVHD